MKNKLGIRIILKYSDLTHKNKEINTKAAAKSHEKKT